MSTGTDYSKIKSIELKNFMGFVDAKAYFDDTEILNFKGYNSSGKSAFLTSLAVALMNMYPQKHAKYIHYDAEYFRIIVTFDDGVVIVRDKYKNGQGLYEMYKDGTLVFSTKVGNKLTKIDDVPKPIKDYLGLIETELGYLNYQVRRDPLWLVETKGSENYYTLNEVLKSEEIARANALINSDRNQLNAEITEIESELSAKRMQLDSYSGLNEDLLVVLSEREIYVQELLRKYDSLYNLVSTIEELEGIESIPDVSAIDSGKFDAILLLNRLSQEISSTNYCDVMLDYVSTERLSRATSLKSLVEKIEVEGKLDWDAPLDSISIEKYPPLGRIQNLVKEYKKVLEEIEELSATEGVLEDERSTILSKAEESGIKFVVCDNCGTLLEVSNE